MSIPTLQGLQTALSGLLAGQEAIDVAAQNITNASTPGYSRERAVMQADGSLVIDSSATAGRPAQLGTGVSVSTITRVRNSYLDAQYRAQNAALGAAQARSGELQQVQSAFDEPSDTGLSAQLSAFWSAWSELSGAPSSEAAREAVVSAGGQLAGSLNELSAQISTIAEQAQEQYAALTGPNGEVQDDATQIALLNQQIAAAEESGREPNELLDSRDELLDQLSGLAQIAVTENADGTDTVGFGDASQPLVQGASVDWPQTLTAAAGGQLGALLGLSAPTGTLAGYQAALDEVASELSSSVNALQPTTPFFTGTSAASIAVGATPAQIQTAAGGEAGGNELALSIAALRGGGADQSYGALIERIGSDAQSAEDDETTAQAVTGALEDERQSVSGVSLDEEMSNLVSLQHGYEASARALTTMDEMLETLIEHTGTTGL